MNRDRPHGHVGEVITRSLCFLLVVGLLTACGNTSTPLVSSTVTGVPQPVVQSPTTRSPVAPQGRTLNTASPASSDTVPERGPKVLDAGDKTTLVKQSSPLAGSIASNDWVCTNKGNDWTPVKASFGEERGGSVPDYGTRWTDGYNSSVSGFGVGAEVAEADKWPGGAPGFQVAFKYANSQLSLTFDSPPANHGVSMLEIQTVPTHHANWTSGFGDHSFARHPIIERSATESHIQLVNPTPPSQFTSTCPLGLGTPRMESAKLSSCPMWRIKMGRRSTVP